MLERVSQLIVEGRPVNLVTYGDSISSVNRSPGSFGGASRAEMNWAFQLQRLLAAEYPGANFVTRPFGVGGQNSYEGLGRFGWLKELDPHLVLIAFGTNDCDWHEIPPYCSAHAIKTLALGVRHDFSADVVIVAPECDPPAEPHMRHVDETVDALRKVAEEIGSPFVDMRAAMLRATDGGARYTDYHPSAGDVHPTDLGHALWAETVFDVLKSNIRR